MLSINSEVIRSTANEIKKQNESIFATLQSSQAAVASLSSVWKGQAAEATIGAYNDFASKYFMQYRDDLDRYVKFLNVEAASGYEETEQKVQRKADEI